ncbi:hypothetical protein AB0H63_23370 [Micromonospora echinospora]
MACGETCLRPYPIWIAADGIVRLVDHDTGNKVARLAPDFRTLLEDNVHG